MKISLKIIITYILTIAVVVALNIMNIHMFDKQRQYVEFLIDFINIILAYIIFKNIKTQSNGFVLLPISMVFLFLMDVEYQIFYYFNLTNYITMHFILYGSITFAWYVIIIVSLLLLLIKFAYYKINWRLSFISFICLVIVIIFFFSHNFIRYLQFPYNSVDLSCHIIIFYLCILIITSVQNKYILLIICGLCFAEIGNFAMTECYLLDTQNYLFYGECCWMVGKCIIAIGFLHIIKFKMYNPNIWMFKGQSIKNKLSFLISSMAIGSFILACVIMQQFIKIKNYAFVFIPSSGMLYSIIVAVVSVIAIAQIEKLFLKIQSRITSLFSKNNNINHSEYSLIEFQKLDNHIVESYEHKKYFENTLISAATRIAHDIKSPIQIIQNLIRNWQSYDEQILQKQILKQINKINSISKNLLNEHNRVMDSDSSGYLSLYSIIYDLIEDKYIEWGVDNEIMEFLYYPNQIIWLDQSKSNIKTVLSNILNNSHEANKNTQTKIIITVELINNDIMISIKDFGCGIEQKNIFDILNGKSFKVSGNGIGLSSAFKFMSSIDGSLNIESEINKGTNITLRFPISFFPDQFAQNITIKTRKVVIVDDSSSIIYFWQQFFLFENYKINYQFFVNFKTFQNYLSTQSSYNDITFLLDFKIFGEKLTGLDVIKQFDLQNVYLITDYAEDIKLQKEIKNLKIKLIPKSMLNIMHQNNAILTL